MIRVLQMGMTDNLGGIETYLINYYRHINKKNIQFDFTNIYSNDLCFQKEIQELGGKVYKVPNYYKHPIKYIKEVAKLVKEKNYTIVHCNMSSAVFLFPLIASKLGGAKVIIAHSHNSLSDKGLLKTIIHNFNKHFIPLFANVYFSCSQKAGEWFFSKKIICSEDYKIINNAIEINKFSFDKIKRYDIRKKLNIDENDFVIGNVGRLEKIKNQSFLIDIFKEMSKTTPNAKLIIVGDGSLKKELRKKAEDLDLKNKIIFTGRVENVSDYYNAFDVFALPSLNEGFGIVLIEAQSNGLPCITTDKIPVEARISDNFIQTKLEKGPKIWADEILKIKEKRAITQVIEKNKYDIQNKSKDLETIYQKLVEEE